MALPSTDWHRALLARALLWLETVRIEEQGPGDCLLSLLYSPWSRIHPPLPQGTHNGTHKGPDRTGASPQVEEVLFNSAALLEWPRAACKPDDPAQVRGWRTGPPGSCSCPSPTRPAAIPHCPEDTQLLGCRRALPCPLAAHRSGPSCSTLGLGGNCPGQTKALAAAGATKMQAGAPTQHQPAGFSVSHGVGGDRVGQERASLGTLLLS